MPHPKLMERWSAGLPAFGGWLTSDSESTIQTFGRLGYDYVGIDTQHTPVSDAQAAVLVRRLSDAPFALIVRVAKNDSALIGRVLDAGADGIIVPMINTAEEAATAVSACRYPPDGVRSFGPMRADLGLDLQQLQDRVSCFVMIETSQGLENVNEICAVPGLAGVYIGPADLSIGLGLNPMLAFSSDQLLEAFQAIEAACSKFDLVMGAHSLNGANAARWASRGCRLISVGADSVMLATIAAQELETARQGVASPSPGQ
jgi:4-hydroxy-2-oxoheptanedioate aldolase